jgi:hypothetical protein
MKITIAILAVLTASAFAGEVLSGGSELIRFKGYGTFRWNFYGTENNNPGSSMSTYTFLSWLPKLNQHVDGFVSATITTGKDENPSVLMTDCVYLNLHLSEHITLTGGQFKKPFGYGFTRSGGSMHFADRTTAVGSYSDFNLFGGRDLSTMITARFAPVTVDLALSNGNGANAPANDELMKKQFTARVVAKPAEWLELGGSMAMIGMNESDTEEAWKASGMDFYAVTEYPVSHSGTIVFAGEYLMYGAPDNLDDAEDGSAMSLMAGYDVRLGQGAILGIMPAVRFDMVAPMDSTGLAEDTGMSVVDFCVNVDLFSDLNTLQLGIRNYGYDDSREGYTDMYANWRMNF